MTSQLSVTSISSNVSMRDDREESEDRVSKDQRYSSAFPLRRIRLGTRSPEVATISKVKVSSRAMAIERVRQVIGTDSVLDMATFDRRELVLGKILGQGSFSVVEEITAICFLANSSSITSQHRHEAKLKEEERSFLAQHCLRSTGNLRPSPRYAIKRLQKDGDWNGVADLVIESHFLQRLQHPNLIKLRAVCMGDMFHRGFFLVLDRLYCTLHVKLRQWKREEGKWWNCRRISNLRERLVAAYHLASALQYLHEQRICHRDVKPENAGLDIVSNRFCSLSVSRIESTTHDSHRVFHFLTTAR